MTDEEFQQALDEYVQAAAGLIACAGTDAQLNDIKSQVIGNDSALRQLERGLWAKSGAKR